MSEGNDAAGGAPDGAAGDDRPASNRSAPGREPADARPRPDAPATDLRVLTDALAAADADAFVAVGDRFDDDLRYLTRFAGPDRDFALVVTPETATLCAPTLFAEQAEREFAAAAPPAESGDLDRRVETGTAGDPAGERAAAVVTERAGEESAVLVPQSIPHDAAVYLEQAGHAITSTDAVAVARERKEPDELECLRRVQRATARGMARAETVLAESQVGAESGPGDDAEPVLVWEGGPLSTERLRRQVNATLAAYGVRDAGNTVIGAGPSAADLHYTGVDLVRPGETVLLDLSPRGPHGYYGDMTRTFVVEGEGGWERRAYVAVRAAREAALAEVEPGATAATVHEEAAAELAAHGFDPTAGEGEAGFTHGTGHGVGVSLHEGPSLSAATELRPGHVVTVEPGVYDPETGGVRLEDLVAVTEDGYEILHEYPLGSVPERR
ncbi:Xaa-Pro peptidase family protein [Haloparvum alkalitolerans]|uniref:M24 family metallopeptidase n=1 Tax=Haloparvum alkalitolerans TaxID=1042953 RepID=UPI003CF3B6BB